MNVQFPYPFPVTISESRRFAMKETQNQLNKMTLAKIERDKARDRRIKELESRLAKYETP